ncbi:hypothetical protein EDB86DRAFT_2829468 [Lactarius hatsudake]|nr:hypothetical protein EDB86DRAFT_2829468 [Lactarius hatsudake]
MANWCSLGTESVMIPHVQLFLSASTRPPQHGGIAGITRPVDVRRANVRARLGLILVLIQGSIPILSKPVPSRLGTCVTLSNPRALLIFVRGGPFSRSNKIW